MSAEFESAAVSHHSKVQKTSDYCVPNTSLDWINTGLLACFLSAQHTRDMHSASQDATSAWQ